MLVLPLEPWWKVASLLAIGGVAASAAVSCVGTDLPRLLLVDADRRVVTIAGDEKTRSGSILDDSYIGSRLTSIVWRPDDSPWYAPARKILILPDSLPPDDFRRLRVLLRYGQPRADDVRGRDAG